MTTPRLSSDELFAVVKERTAEVHDYLVWARQHDNEQGTLRMRARPDIRHSAEAAEGFAEQWWGVVVFTCFGSPRGAVAVAPYFQQPIPGPDAESVLDKLQLPAGSIGHHRIQPGHKGAKQALVAACTDSDLFRDVLHTNADFDSRYRRLRSEGMRQWGRTTSFDLLLRAGALAIGGQQYQPEYAYLGGSTGPKTGFSAVWGVELTDDPSLAWAERLLRAWADEWHAVADLVGVAWDQPPLEPCDQENFLCIYQEHR